MVNNIRAILSGNLDLISFNWPSTFFTKGGPIGQSLWTVLISPPMIFFSIGVRFLSQSLTGSLPDPVWKKITVSMFYSVPKMTPVVKLNLLSVKARILFRQ